MSHYGNKDLAEIDFTDIEELFAKLTPEELEILGNEVDPDVCIFLINWYKNKSALSIYHGRFD